MTKKRVQARIDFPYVRSSKTVIDPDPWSQIICEMEENTINAKMFTGGAQIVLARSSRKI